LPGPYLPSPDRKFTWTMKAIMLKMKMQMQKNRTKRRKKKKKDSLKSKKLYKRVSMMYLSHYQKKRLKMRNLNSLNHQ
jgi:hypothetical protein